RPDAFALGNRGPGGLDAGARRVGSLPVSLSGASQTIAFHTFGCKVNQYETEELRQQLRLGGFQVVALESSADVYVVNSCTVTADADRSCRQLVRRLLRERPA